MSTIKVNKIEKRSGSTLELGGACTAVTLACGATQTGFGRTGTVDWCTTAKTSPFTSENGKGYFVNTTSGSVTITLPSSPNAGDIVAVNDYARTFGCNSAVLCRNGSKMCGQCFNTSLGETGQSITLVYVDGTKGWKSVNDDNVGTLGSSFIVASGGTVTTSGSHKIHTFTGAGNFIVSQVGNPAGSTTVDYLVVAGGGGGGGGAGPSSVGSGGGGGGGYRESPGAASGCYAVSPLGAAPAVALPVSVQTYPIAVGAGGTAGAYGPSAGTPGGDGSASTFSSITSAGGGGGGARLNSPANGRPGGSGGGAAYDPGTTAGGSGNTPPVNPPQGNDGGNRTGDGSGGGGGATAVGQDGSNSVNGAGGAGATSSIDTASTGRSGGGGAGGTSGLTAGGSATDGGGAGSPDSGPAVAGTTNKGGGGGGASSAANNAGAAGGSGVVIIRYKFQ